MSGFNPNCFWTSNCGAKDYDFYASWENLTVQRNNLQYIRISLYYWNEIDGWETKITNFCSTEYTNFGSLYFLRRATSWLVQRYSKLLSKIFW